MPNSITAVVGKARPVGDQNVPDAFIAVTGETPEHETLEQQDILFDCQAAMIESLLHRSLPGGLYDRLAAQMLQRAASHLAVSHVRPATQSVVEDTKIADLKNKLDVANRRIADLVQAFYDPDAEPVTGGEEVQHA